MIILPFNWNSKIGGYVARKNDDSFVQEYLYIEAPMPPSSYIEEKKESRQEERGVIIINLFGDNEEK